MKKSILTPAAGNCILLASLVMLAVLPAHASAAVSNGYVESFQKISDTQGGLVATLDNSDAFGSSVANIGDVDDDGISDVAVGAAFDDDGAADRGAVYILFLNADGTVKDEQKISDTAGGFSATLANTDLFGISVTGIGDLDGDDIPDIAAGARLSNNGGTDRGALYILFLNADGTVKAEQEISSVAGGLTGLADNNFFGASVANLGDLDGDDITDIAVGAYGTNDGGSFRGAVYILFLNANGTVKGQQKISDTTGGFATALDDFDLFGISVANIGDLDGDDIVDIAVGANGDDDGGSGYGAVYILFLNADGTVKDEQKISATTGGFSATLVDFEAFGLSVTAMGDLDGDAVLDIAVGAPGDDDGANANGAVFVLFLNADGTVKDERKISDLSGGFTATFTGTDAFGESVGSLGDFDDNGVADLIVGARLHNDGGTGRGAAYVILLSASSLTVDASAAVTEGGATSSVDIVLTSEPLHQVDIAFSVSGDEATTSAPGLCFTATSSDTGSGAYAPCGAWSDPQTITLTATDDADVEGAHAATLTLTASSSDASYDAAEGTVALTITDNDTAPVEEEDDDGESSSSHRRSSGGSSGSDTSSDEEEDEASDDDDTDTTSDLQTLVTALRALLTQLIAQGGTVPPAALQYVAFVPGGYTRDLTLGDVGTDVADLQRFLIAQRKGPRAQALADVGATGYFGALTQAALAEYQAAVGITPPAGYFGPKTRAHIAALP